MCRCGVLPKRDLGCIEINCGFQDFVGADGYDVVNKFNSVYFV